MKILRDVVWKDGRTWPQIGACVALCMLAIWAIFAGIAYATYESAWRDSYMFANGISLLLEQEIARDIELYDLSLGAVSDNASNPDIMGLPPAIRDLTLFDQSANARGMGAMRLVDKDGNVIVSSVGERLDRSNVADQPFFIAERDGTAATQPLVTYPTTGTSMQDAQIIFSRPRIASGGAFDGIVTGAMKVEYLNGLFASVPLPPDSAISLMHRDGTIMARGSSSTAQFNRAQKALFFSTALDRQKQGPLVYKSAVDQLERLGAYRQVGQLPIYVLVGLSTKEFLSTWRFRLYMVGLGFLVLSAIIVFLALMLARELNRRTAAERTLSELAATDALTRLANRRRFDEVLLHEWRRAIRESTCLSLLMIDCDCFKAFNDTYGHIDGDRVLQLIAGVFQRALQRPADVAARFGGEEFVILLPNTAPEGAADVAESIRHHIRDLGVHHAGSPLGLLTVSVGVTGRSPRLGDNLGDFVAAADAALYVAKAEGRDRVVLRANTDGYSARAA